MVETRTEVSKITEPTRKELIEVIQTMLDAKSNIDAQAAILLAQFYLKKCEVN